MPYYELIFETGSHSVAYYGDDDEALSAVSAHHERAVAGELGGPSEHPAERVVKVLKYDQHPADYNEAGLATVDEMVDDLRDRLDVLAADQGGQVSYNQAIQQTIYAASPVKQNREERQESVFKMKEQASLDPVGWAA